LILSIELIRWHNNYIDYIIIMSEIVQNNVRGSISVICQSDIKNFIDINIRLKITRIPYKKYDSKPRDNNSSSHESTRIVFPPSCVEKTYAKTSAKTTWRRGAGGKKQEDGMLGLAGWLLTSWRRKVDVEQPFSPR